MKRLLLLTFLLLAGKISSAQIVPPPPPSQICGIYYDYDAVGQRIKRSHDCRVPAGDEPEHPKDPEARRSAPGQNNTLSTAESASKIKVYPNPTSGPYTIALSEAPKEPVHYHWYNEKGQILTSGIMNEQKATGNIAAWADGMYLLQVYAPAGTESFRVVKVTSSTY